MAEAIAEGAKEVPGVQVEIKRVEETRLEDLIASDAIALGSPTYYGLPAAQVKILLDESVKIHGKLEGKVGMAFTSSGGTATGAETTILSILQAFLVHGMIVQGDSKDKHYGPASTGTPNPEDLRLCRERGRNLALLALKLSRK
jgi:NAD(P)H dehydrogenase (quinone)